MPINMFKDGVTVIVDAQDNPNMKYFVTKGGELFPKHTYAVHIMVPHVEGLELNQCHASYPHWHLYRTWTTDRKYQIVGANSNPGVTLEQAMGELDMLRTEVNELISKLGSTDNE